MNYRINKTHRIYDRKVITEYEVEELLKGISNTPMWFRKDGFDSEEKARKHIELLKSLPEDEIINL